MTAPNDHFIAFKEEFQQLLQSADPGSETYVEIQVLRAGLKESAVMVVKRHGHLGQSRHDRRRIITEPDGLCLSLSHRRFRDIREVEDMVLARRASMCSMPCDERSGTIPRYVKALVKDRYRSMDCRDYLRGLND